MKRMSTYADLEINAMILEKARQRSSTRRLKREELQADLASRQANELPDIPTCSGEGCSRAGLQTPRARRATMQPQMSSGDARLGRLDQ